MKTFILLAVILLLSTYLIFSFYALSLNPAMWYEGTRAFCAVIFGIEIFVLIAVAEVNDLFKNKQK